MRKYSISSKLNKQRVFILQKSELEKRLDPLFYSSNIFRFLKKTDYKIKSIREVVEYTISGFGVGREEQNLQQQGYIQIRPTNLDDLGNLKFDRNIYLGKEFLLSNKNNIIQKDDILFNNTNSQDLVGKTAFFNLDGIYFHSNHITRIRANKKIIRPKFLWILLNLYQEKKIFFTICTNWNNQSGVGIELLNSIKIIVPNFDIQDRIIEIKEKSIQDKQKNEAEADRLLASIDDYLLKELGINLPEAQENNLKNRMFITQFSNVSGKRMDCNYYYNENIETQINKGKYKSIKFSSLVYSVINGFDFRNYKDEGVPYIKVANVRKGDFDFSKIQYISFDSKLINKAIQLKKGNLLLTRKGTFGYALCLEDNFNYVISSEIFYIHLKQNLINPSFLETFFNSAIGQKQFDRVKIGAIMGSLSQEAVKSLKIPFPSLEKQKEISDHITKIREEVKKLKDKTKEALQNASKEIERILLN